MTLNQCCLQLIWHNDIKSTLIQGLFWWPLPYFQGQKLVCRISLEFMDGFSPNVHRCTTWTSLRADYILVTLTSFSRSQEDLNRYIFIKIDISLKHLSWFPPFQHFRLSDSLKSWLCFGDNDTPFSRSIPDLIAKIEIFLGQMDGYSSDLSWYIVVTGLRHIKVLMTLTPFSRS